MSDRVTVAVHALDPISRAGVASQLRYRPEVHLVDTDRPADVALVVVDRMDEEGVQLVRAHQRAGCRVVAVATKLDAADLLVAVEAGCAGMLRRVEALPERLVSAVQAAAAGEGTLAPDLLGRLLEQVGRMQRDALTPRGLTASGLTSREVTVLRMLAEGHATEEIAAELCYSERTVKNVIHEVTSRLRLRNRAHAVAFALREGLI
ncbi:response regulator transcription factor [Actinomycetospora termitidis]|uniref:Response regulator transcription factor n=1 Tax=Actinomycetospora termitidis TaxID=3053470 RepID=A0ABT7M7C4_9PSEU|nr:response regulator transcription factor [Actinomycetospora sp. Odt1-22]MDL5156580.1 response regulator transcription factor [Actinomycetospora sp. Odt1-22]